MRNIYAIGQFIEKLSSRHTNKHTHRHIHMQTTNDCTIRHKVVGRNCFCTFISFTLHGSNLYNSLVITMVGFLQELLGYNNISNTQQLTHIDKKFSRHTQTVRCSVSFEYCTKLTPGYIMEDNTTVTFSPPSAPVTFKCHKYSLTFNYYYYYY